MIATDELHKAVVNTITTNTGVTYALVLNGRDFLLPQILIALHMSHFAYACKMRYPLNLVLESCKYLWFY